MFSQSVLGRICMSFIAALTRACSSCFIVRIFSSLFDTLCLAANGSLFLRALRCVGQRVKAAYFGSFLYRILCHESVLEKSYKNSILAHLSDIFVQRILRLFSRPLTHLCNTENKSVNYRAVTALCGRTDNKLIYSFGAFCLLMAVVPGSMWNNMYALAAIFVFIALYILKYYMGGSVGTHVHSVPVPVVALMIASVLGVLLSAAPTESVRTFMFFVISFGLFFAVYGGIRTNDDLKTLSAFLFAAVSITSLIAIYQAIVGVEIDLTLTDVTANLDMPGRAYSTFANPNNYGEFLIMCLPFCVAQFLLCKKTSTKIILGMLLILPLAALAATYSRSSWVALAIIAVVFLAFYKPKALIPLFIIALCAIPFLPQSIMSRILTIGSMTDTSNAYRIYIWEAVLNMLYDYPITGIGLGPEAFALIYPSYAHATAVSAPHSHMLYMQTFVEMGLLGGISFIWLHFKGIKDSLLSLKKASAQTRVYLIAALSSLCGISFSMLVEYIWFYPRVMFFYFIIIGITFSSIKIAENERKTL